MQAPRPWQGGTEEGRSSSPWRHATLGRGCGKRGTHQGVLSMQITSLVQCTGGMRHACIVALCTLGSRSTAPSIGPPGSSWSQPLIGYDWLSQPNRDIRCVVQPTVYSVYDESTWDIGYPRSQNDMASNRQLLSVQSDSVVQWHLQTNGAGFCKGCCEFVIFLHRAHKYLHISNNS